MRRNVKVYRSNYHHFTFCPKYRRAVLDDFMVMVNVKHHINHICKLKGIQLYAVAVEADHVHILCALPKTMSPSKAAHLIKWYSSIWTRKNCPWLKDTVHKDHLWQHNYFSATVGHNHHIVKRYINNQ